MKSKLATMAFVLSLLPPTVLFAQDQCGTVCPVCTGELKVPNKGQNGIYQGILPNGRFNWFSIYVPAGHDENEEKGSTTFSIGFFNRLETGITLGFKSWEWRGKVKALLVPEKRVTPALLAGIGNLRPSGTETNGYVMLAKGFSFEAPFFLHTYLGAAKPFDGRPVEAVFGVSLMVGKNVAAMSAFDGQEFHAGGAYQPLPFANVGLMWVGMEHAGFVGSLSGQLPFLSKEKPTVEVEQPEPLIQDEIKIEDAEDQKD